MQFSSEYGNLERALAAKLDFDSHQIDPCREDKGRSNN
jgi:hypothetical protein